MSTRIYIANLGKYNEGYLVGEWIDLPFNEEELQELFCRIKLGHIDENGEYHHGYSECNGMYIYEEWAIHDYETDLPITINEYTNLEELNSLVESLESYHDYDMDIIKAIMENTGYGIEESIKIFEDGNYMFFSNVTDCQELGEAIVDEGMFGVEIPDSLSFYIDYEKIGRDLTYEGWGFTEQGAICVN